MADSPPSASMCCRYHPLGKGGGSALTPPPTKTEAHPSSWTPSLLAPSAHVVDLILLRTEEALGGGPTTCRTTKPGDLLALVKPRREVGPGGNPLPFWGPAVLFTSSCGDGAAHLRSWLRVLLVFWWNRGCWLHLGITRGTHVPLLRQKQFHYIFYFH